MGIRVRFLVATMFFLFCSISLYAIIVSGTEGGEMETGICADYDLLCCVINDCNDVNTCEVTCSGTWYEEDGPGSGGDPGQGDPGDILCDSHWCAGLLGVTDDTDATQTYPDGDNPLKGGTCEELWDDCEENCYWDISGPDPVYVCDHYCDYYTRFYTDYCSGPGLIEYYINDAGSPYSCDTKTYYNQPYDNCSLRHCQGNNCYCGGINNLNCSNCDGINITSDYYPMCVTCCYCCGDGVCSGESCSSCPDDCGICTGGGGGSPDDGVCDDGEHGGDCGDPLPLAGVGWPISYWPILPYVVDIIYPTFSGIAEGNVSVYKIFFSGIISMADQECSGHMDWGVCGDVEFPGECNAPCCEWSYDDWDCLELVDCEDLSVAECGACSGCELRDIPCESYTEATCPLPRCYVYDGGCHTDPLPTLSNCIVKPANRIRVSNACDLCTCFAEGGICAQDDECCPGFWCDTDDGRCCPDGSYWDSVDRECKQAIHENCCDNSFWDTQTRCGGCCGPAENCSAGPNPNPYYMHDPNEIWQCSFDPNYDSIYSSAGEDCDSYDGCYAYGADGCEDRDYFCANQDSAGGFGYNAFCDNSYSNRNTDSYDPFVNYCSSGDTVRRNQTFHDYSCDGGACTDHTSEVNDELVEDCDASDGWNGGGNTAGCGDDPTSIYTDYYCSGGACASSDTNSKDCDGSDVCGNVCDGTVIKSYQDYYVVADTNQCTFEWGSIVEDCAARLPTDSDGGDVPSTAGTCTNYTGGCSGGACPSNTYSDVCDSGTRLTEYYASGASCPSKTYGCSDFEVASTGDTSDNPSTTGTCTAGTGAGCSSGRFSTTSGSSGAEGCIDSGACPGGANCVFREYYASDTGDSCPGLDTCTAKTYDPDTNLNTCSACVGSGKYDIGGISGCCGDDASENVLTRQCDGFACETDTSDDACCDLASDCVWQNACHNNGDPHPTFTGGYCVNGVWEDITDPTTTISPNGGTFAQTSVDFELSCSDCSASYYKIINQTESCGSTGFTPGNGTVTCPAGQNCDKIVCYFSEDSAGNTETTNQSNVFSLGPCKNKQCGEACFGVSGICNGADYCYTDGGCFLDCEIPPGTDERKCYDGGTEIQCSNFQAACGRSGAYKSEWDSVCNANLTSCEQGGSSAQVTGDWSSYTPPAGYYGLGYEFHINLGGITSPSGFTILAECAVNKSDNSITYFDNWGSGNVDFSYTIQSDDPEGIWTIDYCELWSDFYANQGWPLKQDASKYQFTVDLSPPDVTINDPQENDVYEDDFLVRANVTDDWSPVTVSYRWENATENGTWEPMGPSGGFYTATFDISWISNGNYSIRVRATDSVGLESYDVIDRVEINRQAPDITILLPDPGWKNSDFKVKARVTDNVVVDSVWYSWENLTNAGPNSTMNPMDSEYSGMFPVYSVSPGNYTIKISANDTDDNEDSRTISNVGIDYVKPSSQMTEPAPPGGGHVMSTAFNISWSGSDQHSGVKCHNIYYEYCPPGGSQCSGEQYFNFPGDDCTGLTRYEFDARDTGIENLNGYTFHFKSRAEDNAGNLENDKPWETNVTIFIPQLVTFSVTENETGRVINNYGGRTATNRTVVIDVQAKEDVTDNLNITICHYNRTLGGTLPDPSTWYCKTCADTRSCNKSIKTIVSSAEDRIEVDYYIYAENASDASISEFLPPGGYFYYTVYHHPLCNFLIKDILKTTLGSSELIGIEVRNIQETLDRIELEFPSGSARFIENNLPSINVTMKPSEEKIIYARLAPPADNLLLSLVGNSTADPPLLDTDEVDIIIGLPANFSGLGIFWVLALVLLATLVYVKLVSKNE